MPLLRMAFARREALLSSRIEGVQTRLDELFLAEVNESPPDDADLREVQNYILALNHGVARLKDLPIATRLVLELHERLTSGVRGGDKTPGEFRRIQNFIGGRGDTVETAKYVPPPVSELNALLSNWESFVNDRGQWPDLVQCAIMHEQFEAIHPFQDGNGRVGRLLITLFLLERSRLSQPLLYLSAFIEANRREYYDLLQGVRTDGNWAEWVRFFLSGVIETSGQVLRQALALDEMRQRYRDRLHGKHRAMTLLDELFANPYTTAARAAKRLKVTTPTAQKSIDLLRQLGVIHEMTGRSWGRIFMAKPILDAIETPPPPPKDSPNQ